MEYVIVSTAVTDDLNLADGTYMGKFLGGAGSYALCGIRLWTENPLLVAGVGKDFYAMYGDWFQRNKLSMQGLLVKDEHTAISKVEYQADGERAETPPYGLEHYQRMETTPLELRPFLSGAKGVYQFKDDNPQYWEQLLALKKEFGYKLMWEINASCANQRHFASVRDIAKKVDVFSLNRAEAFSLFGTESLEEAVGCLISWEIPLVFLRLGAQGAVMLSDGKSYRVPSVPNAVVVDATGGGNSSSAGVLYGFCEGLTPVESGVMGSISAAACIRQYGVPASFGSEETQNARLVYGQMMETYLGKELANAKR